ASSAGRSARSAPMWCWMRTPSGCMHGPRTERHIRLAGPMRRWHCPRGSARLDPISSPCPDVSVLPPGAVKDVLAAAGVRGWACVPLIRPGRAGGIMGFDALQRTWDSVFPLPVLRLAGDAVANAIERGFLERDRSRLTTRLERARRMQMIGSLASGIAHNFNNIIGAILGYSEMVEPELPRGTKPARHIDEIRCAAEGGSEPAQR